MENKVSTEQIFAKIKASCYIVLPDGRTTVCMLTLENGYTVNGMSACVDAANFNMDAGREIAYKNAVDQIWPLEGYLLAEKIYRESLNPPKSVGSVIGEDWGQTTNGHLDVNESVEKATFQSRNRKSKVAPYGFRKDGMPKKRPGRPAK